MKIRSLDANSEIRANAGIAPARQSDVTGSAEAQKPSRRSTHYRRTCHALQSDKAMDAPVTNYYAVSVGFFGRLADRKYISAWRREANNRFIRPHAKGATIVVAVGGTHNEHYTFGLRSEWLRNVAKIFLIAMF
ncbi:hypothetical protein [Xanthomonas arboricola]|uniref:hypothetical protein n=1 Tax=Xanthomonas arboricola TaxID=56448 RepID=UPI001AF34302|nr:hypothetical protein [Xanthomonas arboricola]CAD7385025.1 hypothetical protein X12_003464 [Xanthomonas arboricola]CAG2095356.1 hypothetical protein XCY_003468 [Xanthomonas arboricola pv. juglandis]